ncbi:MAG: ATP-dependent DNA helicase RecG, partial [Oscillospiraceae bacterium]|nr:ATP-dependent DNA helicase RecG [Oscillospiraceae bacterium]
MMDIQTNIQFLKGVGEVRAKLFFRLGVNTVGDLLSFYPRGYEDWSNPVPIWEAPAGQVCCVRGIVSHTPSVHRIPGGTLLVKTMVTDGAGLMNLTFFNNKYVVNQLTEGEEYLFFGKVTVNQYGGREMLSPRFAKREQAQRIRPVYRQTEKLSSKTIETCMLRAFESLEGKVEETLPDFMIEKYKLLPLFDALRAIHFPSDAQDVEDARRRLIFEELLFLQLGLFRLRESRQDTSGVVLERDHTEEFLRRLPFSLTNAQRHATGEALADMRSDRPMNRILQGDVGSGKTAVAAALIYNAAKNGYQSALMAPTEVLAEQHLRTFAQFFQDSGISFALLTGSNTAKEKREIKARLKKGEISLIIGTHALIQNTVEFQNLGFVITDEQHRFGVDQRAALTKKGDHSHVLVMSATPIPRTLGLIIYGDLDISVLDELPPGRQPVKTYRVDTSYRERIYRFMQKQIHAGRQVYVVCPLIEEGETDLVPAEQYAEQLRSGSFRGYQVGLLHGRMKNTQKDAVMQAFHRGEIQVLVSTVVVEVGVDVPNATVMVIENAERFGLSQL